LNLRFQRGFDSFRAHHVSSTYTGFRIVHRSLKVHRRVLISLENSLL
jgi:hypothetical protein